MSGESGEPGDRGSDGHDRVEGLDRGELAVLVREYLLAGQLMDRAAMPHVISAWGREEMGAIAIDEWMGASPIYTRRMQRLLGFAGDGVDTLLKGMQLDIGAPPEFMDFRLRVIDHDHGEFWLDHCGALMDVEPMGEEFVRTMCHTIEDPTFDATAMATNPRARVRPLHRPPRSPSDRHPHCHWMVTIDPQAEPLPEPAATIEVAASRLASRPVPTVAPHGRGGWDDYRSPLDPDLRLEVFSAAALRALVDEVGVQTHLLVMSLAGAVRRRHGDAAARSIVAAQLIGSVGLSAERLRDAFDLDRSAAALGRVLALHPAFVPADWAPVRIDVDDERDEVRLELLHGDAMDEPGHLTWHQLLTAGPGTLDAGPPDDVADRAMAALVRGHDARWSCHRADPSHGAVAAWHVTRDDVAHPEAPEVELTRFSTGAEFRFSETPVALR